MTETFWYLDVSLPVLLRHARRTYGEAMRAALASQGLDDIPANGLYLIGVLALSPDGVPIGHLVKDLGVTKQGAGQLVETLVVRGYLQRTPDERDRRHSIVTLTERGRMAAETQTRARQDVEVSLQAIVSASDMTAARRVLAALIDLGRQTDENR